MKKFVCLSTIFIFSSLTQAETFNFKNYSDCVGLQKNTKTLFGINDLSENLRFNKGSNNYYALPIFDEDENYCILINEDKKKIIDQYPSMWNDSCLGEWDEKALYPTWIITNNGGKQDKISILISDDLKNRRKLPQQEMKEILERFKCIYTPYRKEDIVEINNVAFYLGKLGYDNEAIDLLNSVLKLDSNRPVAYLNLYESYKRLGIEKKAKINLIRYRNLKDNKVLNK